MNRREFLQLLSAASAAGLALPLDAARAEQAAEALYDAPAFGNVSLLHITDCHAQLRPIYFREPNVNIGVGAMANRPPHLVGEAFLKHFGVAPATRLAHAFTFLDFERYAAIYGKVGGFAHLATLVKRLRATRPGALLLDGGDTWQGSGAAMWTQGQDMVDAAKLLGVDVMTLHWECTYGQDRVKEIAEKDFAGHIDIVAQNIKTTDFGDPVFKPYVHARDQWRQGGGDRPGLSLHAHRQSALHGLRLDLRHPGRQHAEDGRRRPRRGRPGRGRAVA